ncbi:expressed unknown protein [Seminavis robusta]|uniref:Uncharacterized protein n=1 Tax=Seminavis robusta TaxID=568900 RepID=A0A9N8H1L6_9STRA|nr:expressed unknown protein [Seminavis robusta]|eukprot:Sro5_g004260.1 n/a (241) ;mRNA; f:109602-110324
MIIPSSSLKSIGCQHQYLLHHWEDAGLSRTPMALSMSSQEATTALATSLARGGAAAVELFAKHHATTLDLGRVRMRLDGLQVFATLAALLTNGCLRLYSSVTPPSQEDEKRLSWRDRRALDLFYVCTAISILSGSYTTIVFGLLSLYSKTALGRGLDDPFLEFWAASTNIRESAMESFLWNLVSFELAFILSLFVRFSGKRRIRLVCLACIISCISFSRWTQILILASKYLFPLRAETQF